MFCRTMRRRLAGDVRWPRTSLAGLVVHQHHVGGLDGRVGAHAAHGDAHVRPGQDRGVVDAVAHKGQRALGDSSGPAASSTPVHLVGGKQLGVNLVQPQLGRPLPRPRHGVAGEHDGAVIRPVPSARRWRPGRSCLTWSEMTAQPRYMPVHGATWTSGAHIGGRAVPGRRPSRAMSLSLPAQHRGRHPPCADTPRPGSSSTPLRPARVDVTRPRPRRMELGRWDGLE